MNISRIDTPLATTAADALVVGLFSDVALSGAAADADRATGGLLAKLIERKEITGKRFELTTLLAPPGIAAEQLLVVGLGDRAAYDAGTAYRAAAAASRNLPASRASAWRSSSATALPRSTKRPSPGRSSAAKAKTFSKPKRNARLRRICSGPAKPTRSAKGQILGESVNLTRRLVNEPPHDMYPESFAEQAEKVAKECGIADRNLGRAAVGARAVRLAAGGRPRFVSPAAAGDSALQRRGERCAAAWPGSARE